MTTLARPESPSQHPVPSRPMRRPAHPRSPVGPMPASYRVQVSISEPERGVSVDLLAVAIVVLGALGVVCVMAAMFVAAAQMLLAVLDGSAGFLVGILYVLVPVVVLAVLGVVGRLVSRSR